MRRFLPAALIAALPAIALAAALAPSAIVANPSAYDAKTVTVTGTVSHFQMSGTPLGKAAGFQLCDATCVVVIDRTAQTRSDGSTATVTGTFHSSFKGPRKTFTNAIVIAT